MRHVVVSLAAGIGLVSLHGCGNSGDAESETTTTTTTTTTSKTTIPTTTTTTTTTPCVPDPNPERPISPFDYNGKAWPKMCHTDKKEAHFFGIGDWGGDGLGGPGHTWKNPGVKRAHKDADEWAQKNVAERMVAHAKLVDPDFVLNAGDNFYPGGIEQSCGQGDAADPTGQFGDVFHSIYKGEGLDGKPWFGVLGNHDWGGFQFNKGFDVQIFHTWESDTWRLPGLFWSQNVQYEGFSIDFFMLDSNFQDAKPNPALDPKHNICQEKGSHGTSCFGMSLDNCFDKFRDWWRESLKMLEDGLKKSTADWKIINTHFPGPSITADPQIQKLNRDYGIDLVFTGHTHYQLTDEDNGMRYIISGGGGGVTSDGLPSDDGQDYAYGFVHFTVKKDTLKFDMHTWGGVNKKSIIQKTHTIFKNNGIKQVPGVQLYV